MNNDFNSTSEQQTSTASAVREVPLQDAVKQAWESYIRELDGETPSNIYELFLEQIEFPLICSVMKFVNDNQSRAAILLGLSRGTLRKKLKQYGLLANTKA